MPGLQDGDELPFVMDTPTSKAEEGHDENLPADRSGEVSPADLPVGSDFPDCQLVLPAQRIKLADTKFEFGEDGTLGDEILTPDSSRFWEYASWIEGRKRRPAQSSAPYDKQFVRVWASAKESISSILPTRRRCQGPFHFCTRSGYKADDQDLRYIFWRLTA